MIRVDLLDPPAYSPPYDHALATALTRTGRAQVRLLTSDFAYADVPAADGYERVRRFYRHAAGAPGSRRRQLTKLGSHVPDMLAYRRAAAGGADIAHFQWLTIPEVDLRLLPRTLPVVLTIHDPLRRGRAGRSALHLLDVRAFDAVDAVVVHSRFAREAVIATHGLDPELVHVIRHGALMPPAQPDRPGPVLESAPAPAPAPAPGPGPGPGPDVTASACERDATAASGLPAELVGSPADPMTPVVLCFGLIRPYKGIETLLSAWREVIGAELWIVGRPMLDIAPLVATAPANVRFVPRFVTDAEQAALFARAGIVVLPYERSDRFGFSGVLATALGAGKAIVLSAIGGFQEIGELGAAVLVPPGDAGALSASLQHLIEDEAARSRFASAAARVAATEFSWEAVAAQTLALYEHLLAGRARSRPGRAS
jgi:glycosyltransferase involved in cell wall biosynthesis